MHPESHGSGEAVCVCHKPDDGRDPGVRGGPTLGNTPTPGYLRSFHQAGHGDLRTVRHATRIQLPRFFPHGRRISNHHGCKHAAAPSSQQTRKQHRLQGDIPPQNPTCHPGGPRGTTRRRQRLIGPSQEGRRPHRFEACYRSDYQLHRSHRQRRQAQAKIAGPGQEESAGGMVLVPPEAWGGHQELQSALYLPVQDHRNTGKLTCRSTVAAASSGNTSNDSLFAFRDSNSGKSFLIDTRAAVSVFPATPQELASLAPGKGVLQAANGTPILTFGHRVISFVVAGTRHTWRFIVAKVSRPLIGADFLRHSGLLVDVRRRRLIQPDTGSASSLSSVSSRAIPTISVVQPQNPYISWLRSDYPELIRPTFTDNVVKHGVTLPIPTTGPPVFAKARRLPPDKLAQAKTAFQSMLDAGIVRRSDSAWSSPLHLVKKDDGSWHPWGDFRRLNA